jgi:predicted unusual protein kinase regulating ubiquinone biosynthesis (AarF/ABC1/UbiB family)
MCADFRNEALNGQRMRELLDASEFKAADVIIPKTFMDYTTRRILTMEWIDGVKLTTLPPAEIRSLVQVGLGPFFT